MSSVELSPKSLTAMILAAAVFGFGGAELFAPRPGSAVSEVRVALIEERAKHHDARATRIEVELKDLNKKMDLVLARLPRQ